MLSLLLLAGRETFPQADRAPRQAAESLSLVDQARALPAEFRADTLLRIAQSPLVREQSRKQELIEEAYWSGFHAYLPYMEKPNSRSGPVVTNSVKTNRLEALTVQSRAVQAMLSINPAKALRLFEQITPITLAERNCSATSTPDVIDYYRTAVLVYANSFTSKQRAQGEDIALLKQTVSSVDAPAQVPPALEMLFAVKLAPPQRRDLLALLGGRLDEISRSDREYGASETALSSAMSQIDLQSSEADILVPQLRSYIVRHAGGRRCTDNMPPAGRLPISAEQFNVLAGKLDPNKTHYKEISPDEVKPAGDAGTYPQTSSARSPQSEAIEDQLRWLTHGNRTRNGEVLRWTLKERSSQNWLRHFEDASKLVHDLKESDEASPEAFFCEKADALNILATLVPPGPTRDKAMDDYKEFVESYFPSIQNPNLWFTMVRHMLYTARFSDDAKDKAWIVNQLAKSSNPIIALYAKLEARIGPPAETYPPAHVQPAGK